MPCGEKEIVLYELAASTVLCFRHVHKTGTAKLVENTMCTTTQCHDALIEACGKMVLLTRAVARWVGTFNEERESVADVVRSNRPSVNKKQAREIGLSSK